MVFVEIYACKKLDAQPSVQAFLALLMFKANARRYAPVKFHS